MFFVTSIVQQYTGCVTLFPKPIKSHTSIIIAFGYGYGYDDVMVGSGDALLYWV